MAPPIARPLDTMPTAGIAMPCSRRLRRELGSRYVYRSSLLAENELDDGTDVIVLVGLLRAAAHQRQSSFLEIPRRKERCAGGGLGRLEEPWKAYRDC